jgi:hypothetical protein
LPHSFATLFKLLRDFYTPAQKKRQEQQKRNRWRRNHVAKIPLAAMPSAEAIRPVSCGGKGRASTPKVVEEGFADSEGLKTTSAKDHKESNKK